MASRMEGRQTHYAAAEINWDARPENLKAANAILLLSGNAFAQRIINM